PGSPPPRRTCPSAGSAAPRCALPGGGRRMGDLWAELGARLTERRVASLLLPGALYLAVAVAAHTLGWAAAWDVDGLLALIAEHAADPRVDTFGGQALVLAVVVAGSAA